MSAESRKGKRSGEGTLRWLAEHTGRFRYALILLALEGAADSALGVAMALVIRTVIDEAVGGNPEGFFRSFLLYGAMFLISLILCALMYWQQERISFGIEKDMKDCLYRKLLHTEYGELGKWQTGELMNFLNSDTGIIVNGIMSITRRLLAMLVKTAGAFFVLFLWDWRFAVLFLVGGVSILLFSMALRKISKRLHRKVQEDYDQAWNFLQETLGNMLIIRSFRAESRASELLNRRMENVRRSRIKRNRFSNICYSGFQIALDGGYLLGLLWCGWGILQGSISYGTLVAVLQLVDQVQSPFEGISELISQYNAMCSSVERLQRIDKLPEEYASKSGSGAEDVRADYRRLTEIRIEKLSFSYDTAMVFHEADLRIRKGEIVAFTGLSGIGKTTLLKLLLAVYTPESGSIYLDFSDGSAMKCGAGTRQLFSYVPQGNCLLSGTIADAVSFLHTGNGYTAEELRKIREACRLACADAFISELPEGYDTVIGERGAGLSEGQMQRLAIARAIYSEAPILLLDEATSALDEVTERQLLLHLKDLTDKTVLLVTHRRAALEICSSVLEVREGRFRPFSE